MEEEKVLQKEIQTIDQKVNAIVIKDQDSYTLAGSMMIGLNDLKKKVQEFFKPMKEAAFKAHKEITNKESATIKPVDTGLKILKGKMSAYLTEQERIRREEQARLDEQRRKQEEAERKKLEERAAKAEEKGKTEKAEELREKAAEVYVPPVIVQPEVEKTTRTDVGTISQKKDIEIEVTDPFALIKAVASGAVPPVIIKIDEVALKRYVKAAGLTIVPGCEIRQIVTAAIRGKVA